MKSENARKPPRTTLRLDGELTIYRAQELKQALLEPLASNTVLEIDLSGVSEIDTAGMQLLILAKVQARARKSELNLVAHSPAVLDALEVLNLAGYFGDQVLVPPHAAKEKGSKSSRTSARRSNES